MASDKELLAECLRAFNDIRNSKYNGKLANSTYELSSLLEKNGVRMASMASVCIKEEVQKIAKSLKSD